MPVLLRRGGGQKSVQLGAKKIHEQRHEKTPGENAASKLDGSQTRSDDVTDA